MPDIRRDFVVMQPDKTAAIEAADEGLYERLDANYQDFHGHELIACHDFSEDWPTWEIHPHGDEFVMLMSGEVTLTLLVDDEPQRTTLSREGEYVIVPRNTWHTAATSVPTRMLFVTPGEGTLNRAR